MVAIGNDSNVWIAAALPDCVFHINPERKIKEDTMKTANKVIRTLALAVMLCMMLTMVATAAETGNVWLEVTETSDGTAAVILADTAVTDGVITLTYDSKDLEFVDIVLNEDCVAMHAVNTDEAGVVKISWVAPGDWELTEENQWLIKVNFTGAEENTSLDMSGTAYDAAGNAIEITPSNASTGDTSMIVAAVALAAVALVGMAVLLIINMKKGAKK